MKYHTLRLILGDQLNANHSWFKIKDDGVLYVMAELKQESEYVEHHIQKVCAFFIAMDTFANALTKAGHNVLYLTLDDTQAFSSLNHLITDLCKEHSIQSFQYQRPDERRLSLQLLDISNKLNSKNIETCLYETEHFLLPFDEIKQEFKPNKHNRMEAFYRRMRKRFNVLMEADKPVGGKWNYDEDNRNALAQKDIELIPKPLTFSHNTKLIIDRLTRHNINTIGSADEYSLWPASRSESLKLLSYFCKHLLPKFGQFQDAMTNETEHQWSLYHSRLSFSLNTKMLSPIQVINTAITAYENNPKLISLSQVEGFVRQILGWREYVRGLYWINSKSYADQNILNAKTQLPNYFWNGETNMACMKACISQSLEKSYAHHIQRLMVTGNFALLTGLDPDQVEAWYLGIYVDAIEWVEQPNTRSMALFADGGWVATKPYAASGNYIKKMSDYCKSCNYKAAKKTGEKACPFNSFYWHFLYRNREIFSKNPRMAFPYKTWNKMSEENQKAVLEQADQYLENIEGL